MQIPEVAIIAKTQGQDFKIYGSNIKVLSLSPITYHSKHMAKVEVFKIGSNFEVKVTRSKIMVPLESSYHKEHTYEI
jgi:hypothetical protein